MSSNNNLDTGQCFVAYIKFSFDDPHDSTGKVKGKFRPVVIFHDLEDDQFYACKVTSKIDNPQNKKYGYTIQDWKEAGFHKPSIVKCNKEEIYEIEPLSFKKKIGTLSDRDVKGLLIKMIKTRHREIQRMQRKKKDEKER